MYLHSLALQHFRNLNNLRLSSIDPGITVITAPNGVGKSNLLESIYLLGTGSSPRSTKSAELVQWEESLARIEGHVDDNELVGIINSQGKQFYVNERTVGLKEFLPYFRVVFFHPPDLNLLAGSPDGRRKFMDSFLGQIDFEYLHNLVSFQKVLKRRNHLLRDDYMDDGVLSVLEEQFATAAEYLYQKRFNFLRDLNTIVEEEGFTLLYKPSPRALREILEDSAANVRELVQEKLKSLREKEKNVGFSLIGPQRDDFEVYMNDATHPAGKKEVGTFGSRGQQRIAVVHLKVGESHLFEQQTGQRAVLLLDDVFSELDYSNRQMMLEVAQQQQTFITSAEDLDVSHFPQHSRINLRELLEK